MYALRQARGSLRLQPSLSTCGRDGTSIGQRSFSLNQVIRNNGESSRDASGESASAESTSTDIESHQVNSQNEQSQSESINHYDNESNQTRPTGSDGDQDANPTSYLDNFLKDQGAFFRDEDVGQQPDLKNFSNRDFPNRNPEDQLNKGWGDVPMHQQTRGSEKRLIERSLQRSLSDRRRRGAEPHDGTLAPSEKRIFAGIFDKILENDARSTGSETNQENESAFGNFRGNNNEQKLKNFQRRNLLQPKSFENLPFLKDEGRWSDFRTNVRARSPSKVDKVGLVRELIAGGDRDEQQIIQDFDKAKTEINACQSPYEIWEWARENVWGQARKGLIDKEDVAARSEDEKTSSDAQSALRNSVLPTPEPRFGVHTPFYAPVLRQLMIELRQRFRSPQSALNILRVIKNAGMESAVLGCTPALYAEAIKTSWFAFGDLAEILRLVEEAKATGALSHSASSPSRTPKQRDRTEGWPEEMLDNLHNDSVIRSLLSNIHTDAYKTTWNALAKIDALRRSQGTSKGPRGEWQDDMDIPLLLQERFTLLSKLEEMVRYGPRRQRKSKQSGTRS